MSVCCVQFQMLISSLFLIFFEIISPFYYGSFQLPLLTLVFLYIFCFLFFLLPILFFFLWIRLTHFPFSCLCFVLFCVFVCFHFLNFFPAVCRSAAADFKCYFFRTCQVTCSAEAQFEICFRENLPRVKETKIGLNLHATKVQQHDKNTYARITSTWFLPTSSFLWCTFSCTSSFLFSENAFLFPHSLPPSLPIFPTLLASPSLIRSSHLSL